MKCQTLLSFALIIMLSANLSLALAVPTYHFGDTIISDGMTVHGIDGYWFSTSGTEATDIIWFENGWFNYTVSGTGQQQICNGTKPHDVYINGVNQTEGSGWAYGSGIVTVTGATSSAQLHWIPIIAEEESPPETGAEGTCRYYAETGGSIGFQYGEDDIVFTVTSGIWNGTGSFELYEGRGSVTFIATTDTVISLTTPTRFYVSGTGCTFTKLGDGSYTANVTSPMTVSISWWSTLQPLIPFLFIFGMIGLTMLITGPVWAWHKIKEKEYLNGLISGLILMALGFGFFIGWLFS